MDGNTALCALAVFGVVVVALVALGLGRPISSKANREGVEIATPQGGDRD
jgi:hypothetical protein